MSATVLIEMATNLRMAAAEAAAQRMAFLGASGSGKSYGCGRYVEQLHAANIPVLLLDTVGIWPSIRLAKDGKSPGLPFVILGGEHADVPLDLGRGTELGRFLVAQNASAVVDLSDFSPEERSPFVADLTGEMLIAVKQHRRPRVVVFDEAQDVLPEKARKGDDRMIRNVGALIRKGRNHLCGTVLLTQRPQDVSKAALNQMGNLFVGALFAKHERDAVRDWAGAKARSTVVEAQLRDLPSLQPGEFFFWSPSWLRIYERIQVLPKWTFDGSSSTPLTRDAKLDELAPVDVKALAALLTPKPAAPVPEPKSKKAARTALRVAFDHGQTENEALRLANERIAHLEREIERLVRVLRAQEKGWDAAQHSLEECLRSMDRVKPVAVEAPTALETVHLASSGPPSVSPEIPFEVRGPRLKNGRVVPDPRGSAVSGSTTAATNAYRSALLDAIVTYGPLNRERLSILSGKSRSSTTFAGAIRSLEADGLIRAVGGGRLEATALGQRECSGTPLPTGRALYDHWRAKLTPYDAVAFDAIAKTRAGLTRQELAERTGHSASSTTFAASIRRLKAMGLAHETSGRRIALLDHVRTSLGLSS